MKQIGLDFLFNILLQKNEEKSFFNSWLLVQKASICKTVGTRCKKPLHLSGLDYLLATPKKLSSELTTRVCVFQLKHIDYEQKVTFENQEFFFHYCVAKF